jgi:predicted HicB family RNase H-like nuclease
MLNDLRHAGATMAHIKNTLGRTFYAVQSKIRQLQENGTLSSKRMEASVRVQVKIPKEDHALCRRIARSRGLSVSALIRQLIKERIDRVTP